MKMDAIHVSVDLVKTEPGRSDISNGMERILNAPSVIDYLKNIKKKTTGRSHGSLSYLLKRPVSQSHCIRLGNTLEDVFNTTINDYIDKTYQRQVSARNEKGKHQKDMLFVNLATKHVIYAEYKSNIELDTEKCIATVQKIKDVTQELAVDGYMVSAYLVSLRYLSKSDIPKTCAKKYTDVQLVGIREFLNTVLGIRMAECENYETYSTFLEVISSNLE
jgi:hypothetical protein